jgi:3-hydroxyisobutyrate dehydrogenase
MGSLMVSHLLAKGHDVTVTTRTRQRAALLLERGATWADTPAAAASGADAVFSMVGYPADVREVMLGPDGVFSAARRGALVVDMTTSDPSLARAIHATAARAGIHSLDAPVSGGDVGARNATLSIMVGGDVEAVELAAPLLNTMGTFVHQGGPGAGQDTKMVNQILIASNMVGICEGLLYGHRAGLDLTAVLESVGGGAASSWGLSNLAPRMLTEDFAPGFAVDHFLKDMEIALDRSRELNLAMPGLALAHSLYLALRGQRGNGADGTQALVLALAQLSSIDWSLPSRTA